MTVNRRKKNRKQRGSRECGWGLTHRGAGNRGGVGNAGSGKKAKAKMPRKGLWSDKYFGKHGFKPKGMIVVEKPINVRYIEESLDRWVLEKSVQKEGDMFVIDLPKLGYNKLLSTGKVSKKYKITVPRASRTVVEKIKAVGGEVIGVKQ